MVIVSSCTLLLGEDKHANLAAAFQDLQSKRVDLSSRHYKDVTFLLAYAAAETSFQWFFLPQLAEQAPITLGPLLDMATELGRYELLRTCIQAYRLLFVMKVNLADLPTRLAPYVILDRGDGRSLEWTKEGICKKIPDFQSYLKQQCTTLEAIEKAYQASNEAAQAARSKGQQPCLIGSIHPPRLLKQGYKVITSPQGFPPMVLSEEDLHAIALASCEAARILHTKGLVHRDLRFANIIELARRQYVVIDLESVAEVSSAALPGNFEQVLKTCTQSTLDPQRHYTEASDMYSIGILLEGLCSNTTQPSEALQRFIIQLKSKKLSAAAAVQYLGTSWENSGQDVMQP
ncbi:hypothetical protein WJX74_006469 [Apatococcus lobatus]|uniref:Protein kinase domain-containing protein n=1 Tax=Apatococcus lobatus TaxID=904363 RepID=A0AAW1RTN3_9CHLO